jgi:hypothetical protein
MTARVTNAAEALPPVLGAANLQRKFYVTIPSYGHLTLEQRGAVDDGGKYPILVDEYLPEHSEMLEFLIERSIEAWRRSKT